MADTFGTGSGWDSKENQGRVAYEAGRNGGHSLVGIEFLFGMMEWKQTALS